MERLREKVLEGTGNQSLTSEGPMIRSRGDAECGIGYANVELRVVWIRGMVIYLQQICRNYEGQELGEL